MTFLYLHGASFLAIRMILVRSSKCFANVFKMKKDFCISSIKINHRDEFENHVFEKFYEENNISHKFSAPKTV